MNPAFRFIHASDLHLERPPRGLAEVPDHLRGVFVEAPYRAAQRVFDAAIRERVDFVALAGEVVDPLMAGPRGLAFLQEQFSNLAAQGIRVYWAGGRADNFERWEQLSWPDGVTRFSTQRVERIVHQRGDQSLVQILGASSQQRRRIRAADFHTGGSELFTVAIAHGSADAEVLAREGVNYWALGGEHERRSLLAGPITAQYCGSPQGRRPQDMGPRGCTLVQVDESMRVRTTFIATDAVRFLAERIEVGSSTTGEQLRQIVDDRIAELTTDPFGPELVVQWNVVGGKSLASELRQGTLAEELAARLRADHGGARPGVWTIAVEAPLADPGNERYDEETVLGEFLRTVQHYVDHPDDKLDLEAYLSARHAAGDVGAAATLDEPTVRRRVLADVARLGLELLSPGGPQP